MLTRFCAQYLYPYRNSIEQDFFVLRYITPYFVNPFNDFFKTFTVTYDLPCTDMEIRALDCLEYHGTRQGMKACQAVYDDFIECEQHPIRVSAFVTTYVARWPIWVTMQ